jgi:predicted XRE-type DNA-binding protein
MNRKNYFQGTDNVLVDLSFDDAPALTAKAALALKLNDLIDRSSLTHIEAAPYIGMTLTMISQVRRYKLKNISLERLIHALVLLDQHVEIVVRPVRRSRSVGITGEA